MGKPAEPDDPNLLVGVSLPGGEKEWRAMAEAFAEEFTRLGFPPDRLLQMFRDPFYAGPHAAWRALGEEAIRAIVERRTAIRDRLAVLRGGPCSPAPAGSGSRGA